MSLEFNPRPLPPRNPRTREGRQPAPALNTPKKPEHEAVAMSPKRKLAAAVLSVLTVAGLAHVALSSRKDIDPVESAEIQRPSSDDSKKLDIESLQVGSSISFSDGVFAVNPHDLNIRKSPVVFEDKAGGENNRWNLGASFTVVNPVYVKDDINGDWFVAVDAKGEEYFFVGNRGGITNLENGNPVKNLSANMTTGNVIATTTEGSVVKNDIGENELIATITQG